VRTSGKSENNQIPGESCSGNKALSLQQIPEHRIFTPSKIIY